MKRLLIIFFLLIPSICFSRSIHVEYGYTPPTEPAVTGFKLYQEGVSVCQTNNPLDRTLDCDVKIVKTSTLFTLTAMFSDNTESPQSAPFNFTVSSSEFEKPQPVLKSIIFK